MSRASVFTSTRPWPTMPYKLGEVVELNDGAWLATSAYLDGRMVLTRMPDGETATGQGRTWQTQGQPTMTIYPPRP